MNSNSLIYNESFAKSLFFSILIMLLPFIISLHLLNNPSYTFPLMAGAFCIQVLIIFFTFMEKEFPFKYSMIFISIIYILFNLLTLILNTTMGISTNSLDIVNALAKGVNLFLFFGIISSVYIKKSQLILFMKYVLFFALISCIYNIMINFNEILSFFKIRSAYELDFKSFFPNRNQFGGFLFISITAFFYYFSNKKMGKYSWVLLAILIINLILTMSRGALLATIVFLIVYSLKKIMNKKVIIFNFLLIGVISLSIFTNDKLKNFIMNFIIRKDAGTSGRADIWEMGLSIYTSNNVVNGVGFYTGLDLAKAKGFEFEQFHNFFVDVLVAGGIIELLFLVLLFWYVIIRCRRSRNKDLKNVYMASFIGLLSLAMVESISLFSIGYVDTIFTIFFISVPILISNINTDRSCEYDKQINRISKEV